MSSTVLTHYNGQGTSITCTLNSLANGSARQSTDVDNTSNLYDDYLLTGKFKSASGSLGSNPRVDLYLSATENGTDWIDGATGSDAAFTMPMTPNLRYLGSVYISTAATATTDVFSISRAFGGNIPPKWSVICVNNTGLALDSSAGGSLTQTGITQTVG